MNMKKYTVSSQKGFTLVELIVVIVILAILATIAFLSFSSQSASARDSKRKTDLSNIASKVNIGAANGSSLVSFISTKAANKFVGATDYLAGTGISVATYDAGDINFNQLGVNSADFADPVTKGSYKMGATSAVGGAFQLASRLENDDNGNTTTSWAFLVGNYSARKITATASGTSDAVATAGTVTLTSNVGIFKTGDYVTDATATCKVDSVSADMAKIKLSGCTGGSLSTTVKSFTLKQDELDGLVKGVEGLAVKVGGGTTPY
ncbi:MAG: hypothetical protein ACD_3C00197G0004 [uncultured bacterium (gcode 4)]|uniref:Prepilin-type N-terminal cleavage/methylation domain-containing protein n=1 Tax=uncultured bacterium (gcode 4) TaxID=1234023 RepID=K2GVZ1_9BACT|nr:MAG: hypothetical protein ACD_3C00197G0004 [uncultured bacterium (gcode 4)]